MTVHTLWQGLSPTLRILVLLVGGLIGAVISLWAAHASVTEWMIERVLDRAGLGPSAVRLTSFGPTRAELQLRRSAFGAIDRIEIQYDVAHLLHAKIDQVTIEGAHLHFTWHDGKLMPALNSSTSHASGTMLPIARIDIIASNVALTFDGVTIVTDLSGTVTNSDAIVAKLTLAARSPQAHLNAQLNGTAKPDGAIVGALHVTDAEAVVGTVKISKLSGALRFASHAHRVDSFEAAFGFEQTANTAYALGHGQITASFHAPQNRLEVALDSQPLSCALQVDAGQLAKGAPFSIDGHASASVLGKLAGADEDAKGMVKVKISGTTPPIPSSLSAQLLDVENWLRAGQIEGDLNSDIASLKIPATVKVGKATGVLHVQLRNGVMQLSVPAEFHLSGIELDERIAAPRSVLARVSRLTLAPTNGTPLLALSTVDGTHTARIGGGLTLEGPRLFLRSTLTGRTTLAPSTWWSAPGQLPASGQISFKGAGALTLSADQTLPAGELAFDGKYTIDPLALRVTLERGTLTLRDARWNSALSLPGLTRAVLRPGATFSSSRAGIDLRAQLSLQPLTWTAHLMRKGAEPAELRFVADQVSIVLDNFGPQVVFKKGSLDYASGGVAVHGISGTFTTAAKAATLNVSVEEFRSTAAPALFTPLRATLDARLLGNKASFVARLNDRATRIRVTATGNHRIDSRQGSASIRLQPIDLAGEDTLKALSPALATRVTSSAGSIAGDSALHWGDAALPNTLSLTLKDVSLSSPSVNATSLTGVLTLDSLAPVQSAPGQRLTGLLHFPTIAPVPLDVTFKIAPNKLILEHATAAVFGGTLETIDAAFDAATGQGRADLKIHDVNLKSAFEVLGLEQLKGTGRIGGVLPLRIENSRVAVDNGHLESLTPGTVQVGLGAFADQLKTYGDNVDLVFRALTDFHYDRLNIDAAKPLQGAGHAAFRLEGNNPAVMAGHPFVFNINLETDFDKLTALLLQFSGAANTALGWGARGVLSQ